MKKTITKKQLEDLSLAENKVKNPKLLRRIHVIQMKAAGLKNVDIESIKGLSHDTVSRFIKLYKNGGLEKLLERNCEWRPSTLSNEVMIIFEERAKKGFDTAKEAKNYLEKECGVDLSVRHVQRILKKQDTPTKRQARFHETAHQ